jgi:hypothetical protein
MLVKGSIDCQSTNAAIEDSDGKVSVQEVSQLREDLRNCDPEAGNNIVDEFIRLVEELFFTVSANYFYGSLSRIYVPNRPGAMLQPECSLALDCRFCVPL